MKKKYNKADNIMKVHSASKIFHQIHIRLDDVIIDDDSRRIILHTSRTYFYHSLLTNRACDSYISEGMIIRDLLEPGPYMKPFVVSELSNHIGVNALLITKDNWVPFIRRSKAVSVGKNTINCSISASIKVKYTLGEHSISNYNASRSITMDSIIDAIRCEAEDELKIPVNELQSISSRDFIAFYRDVSECGKPQFAMIIRADFDAMRKEAIQKRFDAVDDKANERESNNENATKKDGDEIVWFTLEQLKRAKIRIDIGPQLVIYDDSNEQFFMILIWRRLLRWRLNCNIYHV